MWNGFKGGVLVWAVWMAGGWAKCEGGARWRDWLEWASGSIREWRRGVDGDRMVVGVSGGGGVFWKF